MTDPQLDDLLHQAFARRRAEKLRREATDLADLYATLARRHALDPELIALDVGAVVEAWQRLTG
jgi:hypothetical protein